MQTQNIASVPTLLPSAEQVIDVNFQNIRVETLGFVRLHNILGPVPAVQQPAAAQ